MDKKPVLLLCLGVLAGTGAQYKGTKYLFLVFICTVLIFMGFNFLNEKIKINRIDKSVLIFITGIGLVLLIYGFFNLKMFISIYIQFYVLFFYLIMKFSKLGMNYVEQAVKFFAIMVNILAFLNIYQIVFHYPLLINFMKLAQYNFNYNFGSTIYRTMSIFGHPIVAGLFFVLAFFCNLYIIKNIWIEFFVQILLLVNIYSTQARSVWIALVIGLLMYGTLWLKKMTFQEKKKHSSIFFVCIGVVVLFGIVLFHNQFSFVLSQITGRFGDSLSSDSTDLSNLQRTLTIKELLIQVNHSNFFQIIFGHGMGTSSQWMLQNPMILSNFSTTDNQYLSFVYDFGYFGVTVFLAFLTRLVLMKKRNWIQSLSSICILIIGITIIFFEGFNWQNVAFVFGFFSISASYQFPSSE